MFGHRMVPCGGVAQLVEQENHNLFVRGSSPCAATNLSWPVPPTRGRARCVSGPHPAPAWNRSVPILKLRGSLSKLPLERGESWVVAVSGGADSVFLLRALADLAPGLSLKLAVAHLDHGLRAEASRADARFVSALAAGLGLPFRAAELPPGALEARGASPEEAAREARHRFLEQVRVELGARRIALAHHADDQAETVLLNFLRGTGPAGLAGMRPLSPDGRLCRPLLGISRAEILAGMRARGWEFREDATNAALDCPRNLVRHRILPFLEREANPALREALGGAAGIFRQWVDLVGGMAEKALHAASREPESAILELDCPTLLTYPEAVRKFALGKALEGFEGSRGLTRAHLAALDGLLASNAAGGRRVSLPLHFEAARERDRLVVYRAEPEPPFESLPLPVPGVVRLPEGWRLEARRVPCPASSPEPRPDRAWIDPGILEGGLEVRRRRPGDRFEPWGLGAETKLKDFLIAAHLPRRQRGRLWLLGDSKSVLWVLQLRPSERLRLGANAEEVIEVRLEPDRPGGE
jgi:tRNA(Ile)-lysidine synthase